MSEGIKPDQLWEEMMDAAVRKMLASHPYASVISREHTKDTPLRVVKAYKEYFSGCEVDIEKLLVSALFKAKHDQMIHVKGIIFHSVCAHHMALISGTAHFAYVPKGCVIGLSKIPRLIDAYARRPQVQEDMSDQIVDSFMKYVQPEGCAIYVSANHACMQCRGARSQTAVTDTTAMRGCFSSNSLTKQEFLMAIRER